MALAVSLQSATESNWQNVKSQSILRSDMIEVVGIESHNNTYLFEIEGNSNAITFDNACGFYVNVEFKKHKITTPNEFVFIPVEDKVNVLVQRNWWEFLIKDFNVYHTHELIHIHDYPTTVDPYLNTFLYSKMDPLNLKLRAPGKHHPARTCLTDKDSWSHSSENWKTYADLIFGDTDILFKWIPLNKFPFNQNVNYEPHKKIVALPMPAIGKLQFQLTLTDDTSSVFNIINASLTTGFKYKVILKSIKLCYKEIVLNPNIERLFYENTSTVKSSSLLFPGTSIFGFSENIPAGISHHLTSFRQIPYPEGIFIFALPRKTANGYNIFSTSTSKNSVFLTHNIKEIGIRVNNNPLSVKTPCMGHFMNQYINAEMFEDYLRRPPFNIHLDADKISEEIIRNGFIDSDCPHVYLNFNELSGPSSRKIPIGCTENEVLKRNVDISLNLMFTDGEGSIDATFYFLCFYSDILCSWKYNDRKFAPYYKK